MEQNTIIGRESPPTAPSRQAVPKIKENPTSGAQNSRDIRGKSCWLGPGLARDVREVKILVLLGFGECRSKEAPW